MRCTKFAVAVLVALLVGMAHVASAQSPVTDAEIQRLQDSLDTASQDISQLRGRDAAQASHLQRELDDVRDEVGYMKVKLRKNEPVAREEYWTLRDRIENIQSRARGEGPMAAPDRDERPAPPVRRSNGREIPVGTEFDVRLQNSLSSGTAQVEDRFEATTMVDLLDNDRVLVPAGSVLRGVVSSVNKAGRINRKGSMTVVFDRITIRGRAYPTRATVEQALESEGIRGEAGKIGAGAGVGAVLGAILGGAKGALAGILIGGGGVTAATDGKDVELPAGTILRVRLDSPLTPD
ncbi:MAG TPA: hypothetical protein VG222_09915 [Vicinamibacterales bacterium]|jgi:hypothetical protein|nr:hypothetical protein [Vicinamibacterales bacterium]